MSATVISQSSTRTVPKVATHKPRAATAPPKKRRVVRRRGRGRGELDSDEEIEREVATDSDSDDDDLSSLDTATDDSDTEPASEDVIPHDRAHLPTPRNSKSPESMVEGEMRKMKGGVASFFAPTGDWSEMVADEKDNGPADLPVIDFTDFNSDPLQNISSRKSKKANKLKPSSESRATPTQHPDDTTPSMEEAEPTATETKITPSQLSKGQSARQAYQHKLETDPSFVPTIGNFWGHDDRLIDTEFRSLSIWWRGRGRGRGRGFPLRGRGGFQGHTHSQGPEDATSPEEANLPPIERPWTHDGFEDMKRKEEQRRAQQLASRNGTSSPKRGGFNGAARGGFSRGRGFMRGGFSSPIKPRTVSPFAHSARIRFVMKPELMWTKQHEAFLYFDPALKPKPGHGASYRIKTPGEQAHVVRANPTPRAIPQASTSKSEEGSDVGEKYFVVRLPKRVGKERAVVVEEQTVVTPVTETTSVELQSAVAKPSALLEQKPQPVTLDVSPPPLPTSEAPTKPLPETSTRLQLERLTVDPQPSDPERLSKTEQAVLRQSTTEAASDPRVVENSAPSERPTLPPLQTAFTPPPPPLPQPISQPSPAYGSPYGYHHALPIGVAMNHHGMPYEVATGRPVYFPPPPLYNPRPLMPNHYNAGVFVSGHAHHPSAVSPDFLAQPSSHTPPVNGFIDPATGTPIFSFPRQTSRIEIRAPTEDSGRSDKSALRTSSGLRTTAPTFQPSRSTSTENGYYLPAASDSSLSSYDTNGQPMEDASHVSMAGMMAYPGYQQPYYYPEPYGYPQYMDMSQTGQYDMYNVEQNPQGTVYY